MLLETKCAYTTIIILPQMGEGRLKGGSRTLRWMYPRFLA